MTPEVFPGATYGAFWPNGVGYTSLTLPTYPSFPLYFDVSEDGRIIGKAQTGNSALYWTGSAWMDLGPCAGTNIGAFHPSTGEVYVADGPGVRIYTIDGVFLRQLDGYVGSQGIRCIRPDGSIVSGDATYGLPGLLGQHVPVEDWRIGQGLVGGLDAETNGQVRHVADGVVEFQRVKYLGNRVAAYWTDFHNGYLLQTSFGELRSLPIIVAPTPNPEPGTPNPVPNPEPVPMPDIPSQIELIKRIRAKYPRNNPGSSPLGEDAWRAIVDAAQQTGTLVFRKEGGERAFIPAGLLSKYPNGVGINRTILGRGAFGNQWVKVFGDGEGTAFPIWNVGDTPADGEYVDVSEIVLEPKPTPTPTPNPEPPPSADLAARLTVAEARIDMLVNKIRQFGNI